MLNLLSIKKLLKKACVVTGVTLPDGRICFSVDGHVAFKTRKDPIIVSKLIDIQAIDAEGNWKTQSNSLLPVFTPESGQTVYEASDLLYKTKQGNYCFISGATDTKLVRLDFLQCCETGVITSTDGAFPVYYATEADAEPEAVLMPMRIKKETSKTLAEMLFKIK